METPPPNPPRPPARDIDPLSVLSHNPPARILTKEARHLMAAKKSKRHRVWKEKDIWRYRFMLNGRSYFKSLPGVKMKSDAIAAMEARRTRVREGRDNEPDTSTNFKAFVEETFLPWAETNLSPGSYKSYKWRCDVLIEAFGKLDIGAVSQIAIEKFKRAELNRVTIRKATQSAASVNRTLQVLASIFSRAVELKLIHRDDRPKIETLREENQRIRYLTVGEEKALREAAAEKWPYLDDIVCVGCATGLRLDELFSLKKNHVDLSLSLLHVLDGKGGKARTVPLDPKGEAAGILARLVVESKSEYIFTSPHSGGKLTRVNKSLASACELAGITGVTLHTLRHTFCTRLAAAGVDVRTIMELAGHEDISTTLKYTHVVKANTHDAVRRLTALQTQTDLHKSCIPEKEADSADGTYGQ